VTVIQKRPAHRPPGIHPIRDKVSLWLVDFLKDGMKPRDAVERSARGRGFAWGTVKRCKILAGIASHLEKGVLYWELPSAESIAAQVKIRDLVKEEVQGAVAAVIKVQEEEPVKKIQAKRFPVSYEMLRDNARVGKKVHHFSSSELENWLRELLDSHYVIKPPLNVQMVESWILDLAKEYGVAAKKEIPETSEKDVEF
jgi:hypothetical protein